MARDVIDDGDESKTCVKAVNKRKRRPHETDPWYKRYARDFFDDTRELEPDERGLYNDIIDLIYMAEGPLKDDDRRLAHKMCVDVRKWRRIRNRLLALGMLFITRGHLHNKRAQEVLAARELERRSMGRSADGATHLEPDLFENLNDSNGNVRATPTDIEIDKKKEEKDKSSFEPRVIDGGKTRPARVARFVSEAALEKVRDLAPGWDRQYLLKKFNEWPDSQTSETDIDVLFQRWVPKFTKGKVA